MEQSGDVERERIRICAEATQATGDKQRVQIKEGEVVRTYLYSKLMLFVKNRHH